MGAPVSVQIRQAVRADVPVLTKLIERSVRILQAGDYSSAQLERALGTVYGVDSQLIADGTYFVAETKASPTQPRQEELAVAGLTIVGCGGWSKRKTLYGGDAWAGRHDDFLDPTCDAAKIRAFFIDPAWARQGIGSLILEACENAARAAGFTRFEMGATLTGVPFYKSRGYVELDHMEVPLADGETLPVVRMAKTV
jgi:GNAT superfamily N-acetyltransferase